MHRKKPIVVGRGVWLLYCVVGLSHTHTLGLTHIHTLHDMYVVHTMIYSISHNNDDDDDDN